MTGVGFTGTRDGLTLEQEVELSRLLAELWAPGSTFSHGDCVGSDERAHFMAMGTGYIVHVWPPTNSHARAFTTGYFIHASAEYSARNQSIVMMSDVLIACPAGPERAADQRRSGTWMTVRKARRKGIPVRVIYRDGTVEEEVNGE